MATTPPTLQTAEASGTVVQTSLCDAVEQYEKGPDRGRAERARAATARRRRGYSGAPSGFIGYKVRKYGSIRGASAEGRWWRPCLSAGSRWAGSLGRVSQPELPNDLAQA